MIVVMETIWLARLFAMNQFKKDNIGKKIGVKNPTNVKNDAISPNKTMLNPTSLINDEDKYKSIKRWINIDEKIILAIEVALENEISSMSLGKKIIFLNFIRLSKSTLIVIYFNNNIFKIY